MSVAPDQHCICSWEGRVANYSRPYGLLRKTNDRTEAKRICFSGSEVVSLQPQSANRNETTVTSVPARNGRAFPHCAYPLRRAKRIRQSPEFPNSVKHFTSPDW